MAVSISSELIPSKNQMSGFLIIFIIFLLLVNDAKSDFSFNFPTFGPDVNVIGFAGDATLSNGVIQLTRKDENGDPLQHNVGQSGLIKPIHIYDKNSGKMADFTTEFTFVVNRKGRTNHGDGFAFFFISPAFNFPNRESEGGFLGIFTPETAFNFKQQVLLVEFDSFANEWDPNPRTQSPHIGIDVSSIKSTVTTPWLHDFETDGVVVTARINYDSDAKKLSVSVTYPPDQGGPVKADANLTHDIDLRTILPEQVQIGFSAATGDLVETHDILSWSFTSNL